MTSKNPSLTETHNALPLSTLRNTYLRPSPSNETHTVTLETSTSISSTAFTTCFELVRDNMQDMYKRSDMGWSATRKKKEMKHPAMRFLVLRVRSREQELVEGGEGDWEDEDEGVVGFLSFMITEEEGERVVYCYELQLNSTSRGLGLGRHLMGVMEDFGRAVGVGKAMLTCFAENKGAMGFYGRNGYEKDEISPEPKRLRGGLVKESSYHILSKVL